MSLRDRNNSSEDMFADTRMSFGDHLEDLRTHLWRAVIGFVIALFFSFIPGYYLLYIIAAPVEHELNRFYDQRVERVAKQLKEGDAAANALNQPREGTIEINRQAVAAALGIKLPPETSESEWVPIPVKFHPLEISIATSRSQREVSRRPGLSTLGPMEAFMAYIKVCFVCALVIGSPWIFYQLWSFVAAGLYPNEKRLVNVYLPFSVLLFAAGAILCQFYVIPRALQGLLLFNHWLNLEPDLRFNEWLSFAILLPVLFGVSFQLPLLMYFLDRLGILTVDVYIRKWRIAIFVIQVFASFVTPADIFSMESLALTMSALYGLGILLCKLKPRPKEEETETEDSEALVEV